LESIVQAEDNPCVERRSIPGWHRASPATPLVEALGLTKRFGALTVLREVDVRVGVGELVAVVGENGAGKSSLVACLARVLEPEAGTVRFDGAPLPPTPAEVRRAGIEVVWQDQGLCDDLDVVANVFLGRKRGRWVFAESGMRDETLSALQRVGAEHLPLDRPVRTLSRGQRQMVALGRALATAPRFLVLDEPTASLGVAETRRVQDLIRELRDGGTGILLVTHDLDQVFALADRLVVLREGCIVADVSPLEVHRDDVVALMSGIESDSLARRELRRLQSLVDQLADVEPGASLPLIVSAMAAALEQEMLCVHLLEVSDDPPMLRRSAAVGLPEPMLQVNERLPIGAEGGSAGLAAATAEVVVADDVMVHPSWRLYRDAAAASGIRSAWAAPIVGARGVLGTVSGYGTSAGQPDADRLELATLYLGYAAAAIERERLLKEASRRNRVLETLRGMLETLAGPERVEGGVGVSLLALCGGLGARSVGVLAERDGDLEVRASIDMGDVGSDDTRPRLRAGAEAILSAGENGQAARLVAPDLAAAPLRLPEGRAALVAHWRSQDGVTLDALELLDDASRSLALALEGEALETARRETAALRRSQGIQRELMSWLSHELRTPLTAIQGYASTLCQPDLTWDPESTEHFLRSISVESSRMERLVGDLLDSSAIESGILRLQPDWCELRLVVEAAIACVPSEHGIRLHVDDAMEPIWADHDRLEQVLVNLLENAISHGSSDGGVDVSVRRGSPASMVEVAVRDHGPGVPPSLTERIFEPRVRGSTSVAGAGLGLSIAKGIVEGHGGVITVVPTDPGATFLVSLPAEPLGTDEDPEGQPPWAVVDETERLEDVG
jgi:signal transduction histidine kinase/ABC-type branched-subunit amino acid transport system ATPase component